MKTTLSGTWKVKRVDENEWIEGDVPGSITHNLLIKGKTEDLFYRENEGVAREIARYDYEYKREFMVDDELLNCDKIVLCCKGLDTLAEININDQYVANTDNMHWTYGFDVKDYLIEGTNTIHIILRSPVQYIEEKHKECPIWGADDAMTGFAHLRKGHSMFGWDWGPKIPDLGIWHDIYIQGYNSGRLDDVYITQMHTDQKVALDVRVKVDTWCNEHLFVDVTVESPNGESYHVSSQIKEQEEHLYLDITKPELWWPNGYGNQPLYQVKVVLLDEQAIIDEKKMTIGLRTLTVKQENDEWGELFQFEANGVSIFAMGANYIPEDNLLPRCNKERTEQLIKDCIEANYNCIRVWGGGVYCEDYFYDLCDQYGLIVWQDLMFACAVYEVTDAFEESIIKEAEDNVKRIRHHACLGLWCGNNEIEVGWTDWAFPKTAKQKTDYIKQFEIFLPDNGKILTNLSDNFLYPKDFESLLYTSQIFQAEAVKHGVEHWRRNHGRCMESIYWQLNDCWPVASWSSSDYYGRWKALHYFAKRFYAPILLSVCEEETSVELFVTNETMKEIEGEVVWQLRDHGSKLIKQGSVKASVPSLTAKAIEKLDFSDTINNKEKMRKMYLAYALVIDGKVVSEGTVLFTKAKHFEFLAPNLTVAVAEKTDKFHLIVNSRAYAKYVELDLMGADCIFSDNYFDLSVGEIKMIEVSKESMSKQLSLDEFKQMLTVKSIFDMA